MVAPGSWAEGRKEGRRIKDKRFLNASGVLPHLPVQGDKVCWEVKGMRPIGILGKSGADFNGVEGDNQNGHFVGMMLIVWVVFK